MHYRPFCLLLLLVPVHVFAQAQTQFVPFSNSNIYYEGRVAMKTDAAELSWPGTSVTVLFEGTNISAILKDEDTANYYNVLVDGNLSIKIHTDRTKQGYSLASGLAFGKHRVELFKRTEWDKGKTWFYGYETGPDTRILPVPAPPKRKIEFFGNSITCGYGIEDSSGNDSGEGYFENNYLSYAALTARHFDAQYHCSSKSGIGILVSWFPLIMPEMYDRLDPTDPASKWDFSRYTPDIVVIDLFQNDAWILNMPNNDQFKSRFGDKAPEGPTIVKAYRQFITAIRKKYPNAWMICALGDMDATRKGSPWPGYIKEAVDQLQDPRMYTHFFEYKNTPGHPNIAAQKFMADDLIGFIEQNIKW
jgi:hypothetical protein